MCFETMKELLINPTSAILKAKKGKNLNSTLKVLLVELILIGLAVFILTTNVATLSNPLFAVFAVFSSLAFLLFYGFLIQRTLTLLGGKGKYFEGLTSVVYASFPIVSGLLISSILILIHPIGAIFSMMILLISAISGIATLYRGVKEFFSVEIITAWIGISILVAGTVAAFYLLIFSSGYVSTLLSLTGMQSGILS
jgi:hypothetical protein